VEGEGNEKERAIMPLKSKVAVRLNQAHRALKHAGYSATTLLPGESVTAFNKLHEQVVADLAPDGILMEETVATIAHYLWRKRNLGIFRQAESVQRRMRELRAAMIQRADQVSPKLEEVSEFQKTFVEKWAVAETQAREELGDQHALIELGQAATIEGLLRDLEVLERLDALIDRSLKRLLMLKGLKSLGNSASLVQALPGPSSAA
jgi:hypothetical protein